MVQSRYKYPSIDCFISLNQQLHFHFQFDSVRACVHACVEGCNDAFTIPSLLPGSEDPLKRAWKKYKYNGTGNIWWVGLKSNNACLMLTLVWKKRNTLNTSPRHTWTWQTWKHQIRAPLPFGRNFWSTNLIHKRAHENQQRPRISRIFHREKQELQRGKWNKRL